MPLSIKEFLAKSHDGVQLSQFDLVLVFPFDPDTKEQTPECKYCLKEMLSQGIEVFTYASVQNDELYALIRAPDSILGAFADKIDYRLLCDADQVKSMMAAGIEGKIAPITIDNKVVIEKNKPAVDISPYQPYDHIYLKYESDIDQKLYNVKIGEKTCFDKRTRLLLTFYLLRAPHRDGGCNLELSKLLLRNRIEAMYPLHDTTVRDTLYSKVINSIYQPWNLPFDALRDYFGSQISLYYHFLGFFTFMLVFVAVIGLTFQLAIWGLDNNVRSPLAAFYAVIVSSWAMLLLKLWSNYEKNIALKAGTLGFEAEEPERPEFTGLEIKSFVNGKDMTYYPKNDTNKIVRLTMSIIGGVTMLAMAVVAAIYFLRWRLQNLGGDAATYSSLVASVLNTVQIQIFNIIFQTLAKNMTDSENHRTDTIYVDHFVQKLFVFQFVNSYASFFYLAFIANQLAPVPGTDPSFQGQCGAPNCMIPLAINIAIIFGTRLVVTNIVSYASSWYALKAKIEKETEGAETKELTPPERDYMLMEWDSMTQNIENYADTMVQFGFLTLFVTALPIAGFFAVLNNLMKIVMMTYSSLYFYQRPIPLDAEDIGAWQGIFMLIAVISVITNGGMVAFTMGLHWGGMIGQMWVFILFQWVVFTIQFLFYSLIPDVPSEVEIQLKRNRFFHEKLIEKVADEEPIATDSSASEFETQQLAEGSFGMCMEKCLCITPIPLQFQKLKPGAHIPRNYTTQPYPFGGTNSPAFINNDNAI